MELFHYITVLCISEQEAKAFAGAGVKFKEVIRAISGESSVTFEVGEQDPRWNRIVTLLKSLEGNDRLSKENRVRDLSMTTPTMEAALRSAGESVATFNAFKASMDARKWRNGYSGQSVDELLSLEGKYRDSLLLLGLTCSLLMAYLVPSEPRMATQAVVSVGIRVSLLIARTSGSNLLSRYPRDLLTFQPCLEYCQRPCRNPNPLCPTARRTDHSNQLRYL